MLEYSHSSFFAQNGFIQFQNTRVLVLNPANANKFRLNKTPSINLSKYKSKQITNKYSNNLSLNLNLNLNLSLNLDLLILSQNVRVHLSDLLKFFKVRLLIIDASNSAYNTQRWVKQAKELALPCVVLANRGVYAVDV
jgi:hypothetical protein